MLNTPKHPAWQASLVLLLALFSILPAQGKGKPEDPARQLFERFSGLYEAFDPAVVDLFAPDAEVTLAQFERLSGRSRLLDRTFAQFRQLFLAQLAREKVTEEQSLFTDTTYQREADGSVWITTTRVSGLDGARFPLRLRAVGDDEGVWQIVEYRAGTPIPGGAVLKDITAWAAAGTDAAVAELERVWRGPDEQARGAAAEALVGVIERDLAAVRLERPARVGLDLYLSNAAPAIRRRAFSAYVRGARQDALPRIESILAGVVDPEFRPLAVELLQTVPGEAARQLQRRFDLEVIATTILPDGALSSWLSYTLPSFWAAKNQDRGIKGQRQREKYEEMRLDGRFTLRKARYMSQGLGVVAYVYGPPKPHRVRPTVLFLRGGTTRGDSAPALLPQLYRLADAGFTVVAPQYRGSDGGEGEDEVGGAEVADVLNAAKFAAELPGGDAKNLFLYGEGRGGMMVFQALREGLEVRAAATVGAWTDLEALLAASPEGEAWGRQLWPEIDARRQEIVARRSALQWAESLTVPLLLLHGGADPEVSPLHSLRLATRLQELGSAYELHILYKGDASVSPPIHGRDRLVISWFRRHRLPE